MNPDSVFYLLLALLLGTFAAGLGTLPNIPAAATTEPHAGDSPAQHYQFTMPAAMRDTQTPAWAIQK
jgi:hypothetical protein